MPDLLHSPSATDPPASGPSASNRSSSLHPHARANDRTGGLNGGQPTETSRTQVLLEKADRLAAFAPAILAIRWSTTTVSIALAASAFLTPDWALIPWVAAIITNTAIRTVTPLRYVASTRSLLNILIEVVFHLVAVAATGFWNSPLIFSLVTSITIAAFARGFAFGLRIGGVTAIAVSLPELIDANWSSDQLELSAQWSTVLMMVALIAGYARRISWEATQQQEIALDRLSRLADANTLLFNLNEIAQLLPSSLDSEDVLESTMQGLDSLIEFDSAVILTLDEADGQWNVDRKKGVKLPRVLEQAELPRGATKAVTLVEPVINRRLTADDGGFDPLARSSISVPLLSRGALIGVLVVESRQEKAFGERHEDVLGAFVEPAALAIDNARLFSRLRTVGADEERTRIARDLHDRIGQSLAYLAFELDRVLGRREADPVRDLLAHLRDDLREVVGEVRDTLYDLRTDVGSERDFATTMEEFSARVAERSELDITLECERSNRLPILQEREMWRIAQEALINVERHADASGVKISWMCDGTTAELLVVDDGRGFPGGHTGRIDSYGILGMRERAASIGAALELISQPGEGTTVRCSLAQG